MKKALFALAYACVLLSCDRNELNVSIRPLLHEQFNGKYELISSFSDKAVDLNNDGIESKNLLEENSMVRVSKIVIRIPREPELFLKEDEFVFTEFWPTENDSRLRNKEVIPVYDYPLYGTGYDVYGNTLIGTFTDDLKTGTFRTNIPGDGKNTLIELKSMDLTENETLKIIVLRKLYTKEGWVKTEIESFYKRYTKIT